MRYIKSGDIRQETVNCRLTGIPDCRQLGNRQEAGKFCQNAFPPSTWNFLNSFQFPNYMICITGLNCTLDNSDVMAKHTAANLLFKGTVQRYFRPPVFFIIRTKLVWKTDQWAKIISILVSFLSRYSKFSIEKTDSA